MAAAIDELYYDATHDELFIGWRYAIRTSKAFNVWVFYIGQL